MLFRIRVLFAAVIVAALAAVVPAAPAQAALSDCTAYTHVVCLWKYSNAGGNIWRQTDGQVSSTTCRNLTEPGWNDTVTTFRNQTSSDWVLQLYWNAGCTGSPIEAYYGFTYDLTGNPWDNQISSIKLRVA